ncbi:MAG: hypothetical protein C0597_05565 [Marinilabiliales bacterium]|nr:MAG: hypothetical protein C0597_05565 [Marinilabiliales bacterium]
MPEKAKGLKQINANGVDNTNLGLNMTQKGEALEFIYVDMQSNPITYYFKVPKGMAVKIDNSRMFQVVGGYFPAIEAKEIAREARVAVIEAQHAAKEAREASRVFSTGDVFVAAPEKPAKPTKPAKGAKKAKIENGVEVKSFSGELEIRTMISGIELKDVTGPLTINSMSGPIKIEFSSVNQSAPITITSYSAEIDVTMPSNTKANLKLSSMNGDVYTDFDIKFEEEKETKGLRYIGGGSNISGTINGGGVDIMLKALSDNIYLRKK